jgi:uncharacterized membrane protein YesL
MTKKINQERTKQNFAKNNISSILFTITSIIYFANAAYLYWFTNSPDLNEVVTAIVLGIMFVCIAFSFMDI